VLQDVFGACLCVSFLQQLRLPNAKVAGTLLALAFLYDIFFVFITPLLFGGRSVMIDVVTGGAGAGGAAGDDCSYAAGACEVKVSCYSWCSLYPSDGQCLVANDFLRLLLMFPRLSGSPSGSTGSAGAASMNGFAMLGLGDVVLPSLLLTFALRLDYVSGRPVQKGYFVYLAPGYALGLLMANLAVVLMRQGQPALLYLVPCTLGVMLWLARGRKELDDLWRGPEALKPPYFSSALLGMSSRGGGSSASGGGDAPAAAAQQYAGGLGAAPAATAPATVETGTIAVMPPLAHNAGGSALQNPEDSREPASLVGRRADSSSVTEEGAATV